MKNTDWKGKKIAVLGYGVEGQSTVNYFLRHGALVDIHDQKPRTKLPSQVVNTHLSKGAKFVTNREAFQALSDYDLIMRTPTFPPHHPSLAKVQSSKISSQTKLFLQKWRNQTIGISGTKGKGTVATLTHHLLQKSGRQTLLGGNIGVPLLDIIDDMTINTIAVAELSSFQLWDINISPHIAVLLMVSPEHLELHRNLENYLQAKQNLLKFQHPNDTSVILIDYPYTKHIAQKMPAKQYFISQQAITQHGLFIKDNAVFDSSDPTTALVKLSDTVLRGFHNTQNLAAALAAAKLVGVNHKQASEWLTDYRPLPHRLELVTQKNHISYYDDSIATTPEAAIAGINSFTEPLVLFLGGINKHATWDSLIQSLNRQNIRGLILIGEEAPRIKQLLTRYKIETPILYQPDSFDTAIPWAANVLDDVKAGVILLSPGAKSFDQYQDYRDRGEKFTASVLKFTTQD